MWMDMAQRGELRVREIISTDQAQKSEWSQTTLDTVHNPQIDNSNTNHDMPLPSPLVIRRPGSSTGRHLSQSTR